MVWLLLVFAAAALASCGSGTVTDPSSPPPTPATVTIAAPSSRVTAGNANTMQFAVNVQNASNPAVNWEVNTVIGGGIATGTISSAGLYTAPANVPNGGTVVVSAVLIADSTKFGSDTITILNPSLPASGVFSWRSGTAGDATLSGIYGQETILTLTNVSGGKFGKRFACPVDGYVYAQPLYMANLPIPTMGTHDVVFVATENDTVYAFDAEANPCQTLWQKSFLSEIPGATTVPSCPLSGVAPPACAVNDENDVGSDDIQPQIGITGTPVIDPATDTLYVVAVTKEPPASTPVYFSRLHALDITSGAEKFGGPLAIQASVSGTGDGSFGGKVSFVPLIENQRSALQLAGGYVYIAFASYGNQGAYHGWVLAYNTATLGPNSSPVVFNDTPNGMQGGIWESGSPPSVDANGNIYVAAGIGSFDASSDNADTLLQLSPAASGLTIRSSFTPFNQLQLSADQLDLGTGGVLLLPDAAGTAQHPHLAVAVGKQGTLYVVDRDHLGGYTSGGPDNVVNKLTLAGGILSSPAYWQGAIYIAEDGDPLGLQAYSLAALAGGAQSPPAPTSHSTATFAFPGATPAISANAANNSNGIVWALDVSGYGTSQPAVLHAYDATNLADVLYDSSARQVDAAGPAVKFTVPIIMNGQVFVGTQSELSIYGLAP